MNDRQRITLSTLEEYERALSEKVEQISSELRSNEEILQNIRGAIQFHKEILNKTEEQLILVDKTSNPNGPLVSKNDPLPLEKLRGLSQPRAMIVIAKHFEGYLRPKQLADALISAKLMKRTKNSNAIASRHIKESERFERIANGLYRLKTFETQTDLEPIASVNVARVLQ